MLNPFSRRRRVTSKMFVIVRHDWQSRYIHCSFMYNNNEHGLKLAKKHFDMLNKVAPDVGRSIEFIDFSHGQETLLNYCPLF
jgi:hypothetical protein